MQNAKCKVQIENFRINDQHDFPNCAFCILHLASQSSQHDRTTRFTTNSLHTRPMLARDADSVYWMARYVERAEHVARIMFVNSNLLVDVGDLAPALQDQPVGQHC